jgi:hypothetical protein
VPFWLIRLAWTFRGRRYVRLHLEGMEQSLQGVLIGTTRGHYVLFAPSLLEGPKQTVRLDGHVEVPAQRVLFVQVMKGETE